MFMNKIFSVKTNLCEDGTERILRLGDIYPCDIYPWRHIPIMGDIYPSWVNVSWVPGQHLPIGDIYP